MNSLEFIEKEIEAVEKELAEIVDITNDYLEIPDTYENKYNLIDDANERYSNYSLRLSKLIQIKTELEAWEELKEEIKEHKEVLYEDELTNVLVFALPYSDNPKKYNAIKKAMEVEECEK